MVKFAARVKHNQPVILLQRATRVVHEDMERLNLTGDFVLWGSLAVHVSPRVECILHDCYSTSRFIDENRVAIVKCQVSSGACSESSDRRDRQMLWPRMQHCADGRFFRHPAFQSVIRF